MRTRSSGILLISRVVARRSSSASPGACRIKNWRGQIGHASADLETLAPALMRREAAGDSLLPLKNAVDECAGTAHSCALTSDGSAWCWGSNDFGRLGVGDRVSRFASTRARRRPPRPFQLNDASAFSESAVHIRFHVDEGVFSGQFSDDEYAAQRIAFLNDDARSSRLIGFETDDFALFNFDDDPATIRRPAIRW